MSINLLVMICLFWVGLLGALGQEVDPPVGPSARWCKDRAIHHQPGRYRAITVRTGDVSNPQTCIEVIDTQQTPICRVRFDCPGKDS